MLGQKRGLGRAREGDRCPDAWAMFEHLLSAGEDMSARERQQLALFLVS